MNNCEEQRILDMINKNKKCCRTCFGPTGPTGPTGPAGPVAPLCPLFPFLHVHFLSHLSDVLLRSFPVQYPQLILIIFIFYFF